MNFNKEEIITYINDKNDKIESFVMDGECDNIAMIVYIIAVTILAIQVLRSFI